MQPVGHLMKAGGTYAGLTSVEAAARLRDPGPNLFPPKRPRSAWRQFSAQMVHYFALMLWVAGLRDIEVDGDDIAAQTFHFHVRDTLASRGQKMIYWGAYARYGAHSSRSGRQLLPWYVCSSESYWQASPVILRTLPVLCRSTRPDYFK